MEWIHLTDEAQLNDIIKRSHTKPQVIFKHSTRCSISAVVLKRFERSPQPEGVDFYYLDLLAHRHLSNTVAQQFSVPHESPQILLIRNGKCVFHESHLGIFMDDVAAQAKAA